MPGRARGRSRGQSRGSGTPQEEPSRRPGEEQKRAPPPSVAAPPPSEAMSIVNNSRGHYRGGLTTPRPGAGDFVRAPVEEMAQLRVGTRDARQIGRRREDFYYADVHTRRAHNIDKKGSSGMPIQLVANFFTFDCDEEWALYQYHVDFNPVIDSRKMRAGLLSTHAELLGRTRMFDGMILYLPRRLPQEAR